MDKFHDQRERTRCFLDAVNLRDVLVVQCRKQLRFALESPEPFEICREHGRKNLDRDVPVQPRVAGTIGLAHATNTELAHDLVLVYARAR